MPSRQRLLRFMFVAPHAQQLLQEASKNGCAVVTTPCAEPMLPNLDSQQPGQDACEARVRSEVLRSRRRQVVPRTTQSATLQASYAIAALLSVSGAALLILIGDRKNKAVGIMKPGHASHRA